MTISNTNYFENIKNKCWGAVSHLRFSGSQGPKNSKMGKIPILSTIRRIWYNFVIKNLFRRKKMLTKALLFTQQLVIYFSFKILHRTSGGKPMFKKGKGENV